MYQHRKNCLPTQDKKVLHQTQNDQTQEVEKDNQEQKNHNGIIEDNLSKVEKPFPCKFCSESFSSYKLFWNHRQYLCKSKKKGLATKSKAKSLNCKFCNKLFVWKPKHYEHQRFLCEANENRENVICKKCGQGCRSYKSLSYHRKKLCKFSQNAKPTEENENVRNEKEKPDEQKEAAFACKFCDKRFVYYKSMLAHCKFKCKLNEQRDDIACKLCHQKFSTLRKMYLHRKKGCQSTKKSRKNIDEKEKLFTCDLCSNKFLSSKSLYDHRRYNCPLRKNEDKMEFPCKLCGKTFLCRNKRFKHQKECCADVRNEGNLTNCNNENEIPSDATDETDQTVNTESTNMTAEVDATEANERISCKFCNKNVVYKGTSQYITKIWSNLPLNIPVVKYTGYTVLLPNRCSVRVQLEWL